MNDVSGSHISEMLHGKDRAALMIRHAERFPMSSVLDSPGIGLTEKGKSDAKAYGYALSPYPYYRLFHSPALRCRQTAERVAEGIRSRGGIVKLIEEVPTLCSPYVKDVRCLKEADVIGDGFMREWLEGRFDPEWIDDAETSTGLVLRPVLERLLEGGDHLDIHVSHDWDVMLARETILGITHEKEGWLCYLDGMVFSLDGHGYEACYGGRSTKFIFRDDKVHKI